MVDIIVLQVHYKYPTTTIALTLGSDLMVDQIREKVARCKPYSTSTARGTITIVTQTNAVVVSWVPGTSHFVDGTLGNASQLMQQTWIDT